MAVSSLRKLACAVLVGLMLPAIPAAAQSIGGGVKVGVNFANISSSFDEEYKNKAGALIGGFVDVGFTDRLSFQPELLFSQKGTRFEQDGDDYTVVYDVVQLPLLFKVQLGSGTGARPYVVVGPGFGFRTTAKLTTGDDEEDLGDDEVHSMDYSGIVGAGVRFGRALVEARYDHGFRDLDAEGQIGFKTRTFSILVGVGFGR